MRHHKKSSQSAFTAGYIHENYVNTGIEHLQRAPVPATFEERGLPNLHKPAKKKLKY